MKTGARIKEYAFIALLICVFLLSGYTAFLTYRYYGIVARGVVGLVLIYRLIFWGRDTDPDVDIDAMLLDPKKGKYIIFAFTIPMVSYWAAAQIYEMVLFFWKR